MPYILRALLIASLVLTTATASFACKSRHRDESRKRVRVVHVHRPAVDQDDNWTDSALLALGLFGLGWLYLSRRPAGGKPPQPMV